jgi:anti-repressor protein
MRALEAANETLVRDVAQLGARTLEQEKALEAAAPKVLFADTVTASADSILIGELAKIICQKGIEIGEKRLFAWMRNNGYLCSRPGEYYNRPAQRYIEQGLFEIKKGSVMHSNGTVLVTTTPMVTGKGQLYFVNKFLYQKK